MSELFEPVEIILDKPRLLKVNHRALRIAERELNRMRGATPLNHCMIDFAIVISYNLGMFPRDLQAALLMGFLSTDNPNMTVDDIDKMLDKTKATAAEINDKLWRAYETVAGKNIKTADGAEKKTLTNGLEKPTGSPDGPSPERNLN